MVTTTSSIRSAGTTSSKSTDAAVSALPPQPATSPARPARDRRRANPFVEVRRSAIHGQGGYARVAIARGVDLIEYTGQRISVTVADARYEVDGDAPTGPVWLFQIDDNLVIDAAIGGSAARFINHSCEPNCESVLRGDHVFIRSLRAIRPGEELTYDYKLRHEEGDGPEVAGRFACNCGAPTCRGTMLARRRRAGRKPARRG